MNRTERRALERASKGRSKPLKKRAFWSTEIDTIKHAMDGAAITSQEKRDQLYLRELNALDAFTKGLATMAHWSDLVNINNITQTMAGMDIGREAMTDCHRAEAALIEAAARFQRTGKMGLSGPGIQALREVLEWHEAQRSAIPRSKYEQVLKITGARIKNGHKTIDLAKTLGNPA
jgi:hypothetical protein